MHRFIQEQLLILVIASAMVLATAAPFLGVALEALGLTPLFIVAIFVLQGLGLDVRVFRNAGELMRALIWGAIVAYALAPWLAFGLMRSLQFTESDRVGFLLICCSTPTIVSGIVVATRAGGDAATALLLTVLLNALGILTLPFNLSWTLETVYPLNAFALFKKLLLYILLPSMLGVAIGARYPGIAERTTWARRHGAVILLGLTVLASISPYSQALRQVSLVRVLSLLWPALLVHGLLLAIAYFVGRFVWRMNEASARSTAFVTSQKSLPVTIAVWSTAFWLDYPLALIPALIFHPAQILFDGFVARYLSKTKNTPKGGPAPH